MLTIGSIIKKIRKRKNLTQAGLAQKIGTDDSAIRKYENGRLKPKEDTLLKIANALDINPDSLLGSELNSTKAMHHLFRIFNAYKGEFHTVKSMRTDDNGNEIEEELVTISFHFLNEFMKEWKSKYESSASSDSKDSYTDYIFSFPESSEVDQAYKELMIEYDEKLTLIDNKF